MVDDQGDHIKELLVMGQKGKGNHGAQMPWT